MSKREDIEMLSVTMADIRSRLDALEQAAKTNGGVITIPMTHGTLDANEDCMGRVPDKPRPEPTPTKLPRWKPKDGGLYWYVKEDGSVSHYKWTGTDFDMRAHARGNVYQTEAAALYADKARVALTSMRDWVDATGFVPDWETTKNKAYPRYSHKQKQWEVHWSCRLQNIGTFYFGSEDSCRAFLAEFGPGEGREDRLKYLLDGGGI